MWQQLLLLLAATTACPTVFARNVVHVPGTGKSGSGPASISIKTSIRFTPITRLSGDNQSTSLSTSSMGQTLVGIVQVGTPPVSLSVQFDTGSSSFWVISSLCKSGNACPPSANSQIYNPDMSSTARTANNTILTREYGDGTTIRCLVITDTLSIAGVTISNQNICSATGINYPSPSSEDGLIGLAPPHVSDPADVFSSLRSVFTENMINFYYNRNVNSLDVNSGLVPNAGEITLGSPNPDLFSGNFSWIPIIKTSSHWAITLDSITINGKVFSASATAALVDTGTSMIYLNPTIFMAVNSVMKGVLMTNTDIYQVDCTKVKSLPPLTFTFGGNPFTLTWDKQIVVLQGRTCISVFSTSSTLPTIFGASFLRQFYTTFDYAGRIGFATPKGVVNSLQIPPTSGFQKNDAVGNRLRRGDMFIIFEAVRHFICSGTDNDVFTLNVQRQLVRSQRWFWSRRTKQLYRNRYWLTPQVRPKTVKQRHSFALMETLQTCGDSASLQKYVTRQLLDTCGFFKDPSFDQSRAHGTRYLMLARMDALWTARKAIQIGILVDTHPFSVDHCILCDQQLLSTSIAHLVVECEQVTGHCIQSGLVPAIQKSRLRLLGRALDPGVENVYTWLRGGVLNGEADLDQRWLDGDCGA
ncbi:hypothetical protein BASA83_006791 [Batrachochytrium salamandrivorans]|nr:hypothetical protein BASA83_006791 [Batrachochytrium salamandrivorans]